MKKYFILLISLFIARVSLATLVTVIDGPSENAKMVQWVWKHRAMILKSCEFDIQNCSRDPLIKKVILQLQGIIPKTTETQIKFVSEKENPNFFTSNSGETHRAAMTSNGVAAPIYWNMDQLPKLNFQQITGIMFHELTHHLGILDDAQRIPDLVGAAVAAHVKAQLITSPLPMKKGHQILLSVFNVWTKDSLSGPDFNLGLITSFGFLTDGKLFFDVDYSRFEVIKPCQGDDQFIAVQWVRAPFWIQSQDQKNRFRAVALMNNMCVQNNFSSFQVTPGSMSADFIVTDDGDINRNSLVVSFGDNAESFMDYLSTAEVISSQLPIQPVRAGQELVIRLQVRIPGQLIANQCDVAYQEIASHVPSESSGVMVQFDQCKVTPLGNSTYDLEIRSQLLPSLKIGTYHIPLLRLTGVGGNGMAFLKPGNNLIWKVEGGAVIDNIVVSEPQVKGLPSLKKLGEYPLESSYRYHLGEKMVVEFEVNTLDPVELKGLEFHFLLRMNDQLASVRAFAGPEDFKFALKSHSFQIKDNKQRLRLEFVLSERYLGGQLLYGMRLDSIILQNKKTLASGRFQNSGEYKYLFILDQIISVQSN